MAIEVVQATCVLCSTK